MMAAFLLLHGAASTGWLWHRVVPILTELGHQCVAPDLPCTDPAAGLDEYVEVACAAAEPFGKLPVTVVAQSMAGLIAPLIPPRRPVAGIALLAAMIPRSGETGGDWWASTGQAHHQRDHLRAKGIDAPHPFDPDTVFVHDLSPDLKAQSLAHVRDQQAGIMNQPCPMPTWPSLPTVVIAAADDRLFPLPFMQAQARQRLQLEPVVIPGGHLAALSQPAAVTAALHEFATAVAGTA